MRAPYQTWTDNLLIGNETLYIGANDALEWPPNNICGFNLELKGDHIFSITKNYSKMEIKEHYNLIEGLTIIILHAR